MDGGEEVLLFGRHGSPYRLPDMAIWVGVIGLVGVVIGAVIPWFLAREDREHGVREARRAEKMAAFERLAVYLLRLENAEHNGPAIIEQLKIEFEEVWMPVLIVCDRGGPVLKAMGKIPEITVKAGLEKGTAVRLSKAMHEEMNG